jgi:hypothetical protein
MSKLSVQAQLLTKDSVAAKLLEQIYWRYKGAIAKGKAETPQSHKDLMRDTGFSPKQVKRGLGVLKDRLCVGTRRGLFGGKNVNFFSVPALVCRKLEGPSEEAPEGPSEQTLEGPSGQSLKGPFKESTELSSGLSSESSFSCETGLASENDEQKKACGEGEGSMRFKGSVNEVEAFVKAKKMLHKPDGGYGQLWAENLSKLTGVTQPMPSMKAVGQLKLFAKKCPDDSGKAVIDFVMKHWIAFTKQVEQDGGVKLTPAKPSVDFLLKHVSIAVMFAAPPATKKQSAKHEASPVAKSAQLISQPTEAAMTLAEIMAPLSEEDSK